MVITTRDADLRNDRDELIRFLNENLTERSNAIRFDWLYLKNPFGQARVWLASDSLSGNTVGVAAAFPRHFWISGTRRRIWVLGDFCISGQFRSLGPAIVLQRACLSSLSKNELCYDFPSRSMMAVYRRLGVPVFGEQVRYVKLLRIDSKVERIISRRLIARSISCLGNVALQLKRRLQRPYPGLQLSVHQGRFADEFTNLDSRLAKQYAIQGLRTASYLNWRYREHPFETYMVVVARRRSELVGYAIVGREGNDAALIDLRATDENIVIPGLLSYIDRLLLEADGDRIDVPILETGPLAQYLRRAGFHPRGRGPVVIHTYQNGESPGLVGQPENWLLMQGDRES